MNHSLLRRAILASVAIDIVLVGVSPFIYPTLLDAAPRAWVGIIAVTALLLIYGLVGWFGVNWVERRDSRILPIAVGIGLAASLIFVGEMLLEYLLLPDDNSTFGVVEFGSVFFLWVVAGVLIAYRTGQTRNGILAAISSALFSSLFWLMALLLISYLFKGTPQQMQVFRAEGNLEDYARSGMSDFDAWVMEDLLGAGFFHLLLGPMVAAAFGTLGGLAGKATAWLHHNAVTE